MCREAEFEQYQVINHRQVELYGKKERDAPWNTAFYIFLLTSATGWRHHLSRKWKRRRDGMRRPSTPTPLKTTTLEDQQKMNQFWSFFQYQINRHLPSDYVNHNDTINHTEQTRSDVKMKTRKKKKKKKREDIIIYEWRSSVSRLRLGFLSGVMTAGSCDQNTGSSRAENTQRLLLACMSVRRLVQHYTSA